MRALLEGRKSLVIALACVVIIAAGIGIYVAIRPLAGGGGGPVGQTEFSEAPSPEGRPPESFPDGQGGDSSAPAGTGGASSVGPLDVPPASDPQAPSPEGRPPEAGATPPAPGEAPPVGTGGATSSPGQ